MPPVALRPSYTLPCWRNQSYTQQITLNAADETKQVTFQGIRLDALPSLISLHVTDGPEYKKISYADAVWRARGMQWTEYFAPVSDFSITINEKISVLSDKNNYDLYKMYRMYAPDSKMSYTVWRELRQLILVRSDVLAVDKGQSVFNPTNLTLNCRVGRAIHHRRDDAEIAGLQANVPRRAVTQEVRLNFWYFNDALTLSQQAAAVTSMLLSPSDVQQLRVSPEAKEIQTLMEMGLTG